MMKRYTYFIPLAILEIQIAAAITGCDFCLDFLCLVRTRCPVGVENIFMIVDVDFDYKNKIMYTINDTLKATYFDDHGGIDEIPTENGDKSLVSLAVDRSETSDIYYSTSDSIFKYDLLTNVTVLIYSINQQHFTDIWVHGWTIFYKIPAGLYFVLQGSPDVHKIEGLDGSVENVAFHTSGVAYISTNQKVHRLNRMATVATEFLKGHYLIAADINGDMYFSTKQRLYLLDTKTDQLRLVGAFEHYTHRFLFDPSNYIIMEDQRKLCADYKPVRDHCKYDASRDIPKITKI